jgi:hypothetical protein
MKIFFKFAEICWLHFYREAMLAPHPCTLHQASSEANPPRHEADHLPPTSAEVRTIHYPIFLHCVELNLLSKGTTLPFFARQRLH